MKIKSITYSNFRQFKDSGTVYFSTDGRVTIIYGKNGDGKTTLHQLFQWVLYNEVHFNKTASDKMYNLEYEKELDIGKSFAVYGSIDFEHEGVDYCARREYKYKKDTVSTKKLTEDFSVRVKKGNDWGEELSQPQEFIDSLLPPGLSEYFFFDGESMIADLNQLGINSAGKLKQSLYSIFDLDKFQQAIDHIGTTETKTTVLGKLFLGKGEFSSSKAVQESLAKIDNFQTKIEQMQTVCDNKEEERSKCKERARVLSERIGARHSKEALENKRKEEKKNRDQHLKNVGNCLLEFGNLVYKEFPKVLLKKKMEDARKSIKLKIDKAELTPGINRVLLDSILNAADKKCICGRQICQEHEAILSAYYRLLPPDSYKSLYDNFTRMVHLWGDNYNREHIDECVKKTYLELDQARKCDEEILRITEEEKTSKSLETLVVDRQKAEDRVLALNSEIEKEKNELFIYTKLLRQEMKTYDKLSAGEKEVANYAEKISIMEQVKQYLEDQLDLKSAIYSEKLGEEIQSLINTMLTSERRVSVSKDFLLKVSDSFDDESKSEGQFAIVSFAYIGGILRMLRKDDSLSNKEYPLVLDGPFSKLDPDQRQNVVDTIPKFAPQIILFSKDDLTDCFITQEDRVGRIWTIQSNAEKNVASIKEGFLWTK